MSTEPQQEPTVQDLFDLRGKTALISGASGYLGSSFSQALAEAGARVVVTSIDADRAQAAAQRLPDLHGVDHLGVVMNQMDDQSLEAGFAEALEKAGRLDILVNNGHEALGKDWSEVTGPEFTRQLANATGYFLLARLLREHTVERGGTSSVVMIGSMYGIVGSYPDAYEGVCAASPAAYHALKGGIIHLTRHLGVYWAGDGVRVNCLSPGPFPSDKAPQEMVGRLVEKSPMKRMGKPFELKGALIYLASDASSYVTGQNVVIDGGWTAW